MTSPFSNPQHARAITLLSLAAFSSSASLRLCDPMLPELARIFSATTAEAAHVVSGFAIAYGLLQAFYGALGDKIGKYRLIALCTLLSSLGSLGAVFAASLDWLVAARFLTGMTVAGVIPLSMAWIGDTVPYEQRQATLARFLAGQIIGMIGGQFIGGFFTDTLGWRWTFAFLTGVYLIVGWFVLRESATNPVTRHTRDPDRRQANMFAQIGMVLATPWARVILVTVFLEGVLLFGPMAFVPTYLHERFSVSLTMAGGLMAAFGLGGIIYTLMARHLVRHLGEAGMARLGGVMLALSWLILAFEDAWGWTPLATLLAGLGYYQLHNTLQTNATQMAPAVRGTAVSLFASAFFLGQSLGVFLVAQLLDSAGHFKLFVATACALPLLSTFFATLLARHHRQPRTE